MAVRREPRRISHDEWFEVLGSARVRAETSMRDDNQIPLNCPKCPRPMRFMRTTDDDCPAYVCVQHGWFVLTREGYVRSTAAPPARRS